MDGAHRRDGCKSERTLLDGITSPRDARDENAVFTGFSPAAVTDHADVI